MKSRTLVTGHTAILSLSFGALLSSTAALGVVGCKKSDSEQTTQNSSTETLGAQDGKLFELSFDATPEQTARAKELSEKIDSSAWKFEAGVFQGEADIEPALLLTSRENGNAVVASALDALQPLVKPESKHAIDFVSAVRTHLKAEEPRLVGRALQASTAFLKDEPEESLMSTIAGLASQTEYSTGAGRLGILTALRETNDKNERKWRILVSSLQTSDPGVLVEAMTQLNGARIRPEQRLEIAPLALPLMDHNLPAVRGTAAELVGNTGKHTQDAEHALVRALSDDSPFVKSKAAVALGEMRYRPALHLIVPMTSDLTEDRAEYEYDTLERKGNRAVVRGSMWSYVADAAQLAVRRLAGMDAKIENVKPNDIQGTLKKNAVAARTWYNANKSKIEKLEVPPKSNTQNKTTTVAATASDDKGTVPAVGKPADPAKTPSADQPASSK